MSNEGTSAGYPRAVGKPRTPAARSREIAKRLSALYPAAECELEHRNAFELLSATILSAQCTDARVNMVTPALFAKYPTAEDLAVADPTDVEELVRSTGFYQTKARNLIGMARAVVDRFGGEIPKELEDLVTLPGVGRKTGNVLRSVVFDLPGLAVDTHVGRLSRRLGLTTEEDPVKVEGVLNSHLPPEDWGKFSLRLILHGRRVCDARKPRCHDCELQDICPSSSLPTRDKVALNGTKSSKRK
ncbi:MAG: DNA-(apurinic or apyrimidinic site) lyase [Actinomycetota bacterium]